MYNAYIHKAYKICYLDTFLYGTFQSNTKSLKTYWNLHRWIHAFIAANSYFCRRYYLFALMICMEIFLLPSQHVWKQSVFVSKEISIREKLEKTKKKNKYISIFNLYSYNWKMRNQNKFYVVASIDNSQCAVILLMD